MIYRQERLSDKEQVKKLWKTCFDDTEKFVDWFFGERWMPAQGAVAEEHGKIITAIQGWHYTLNIRGKSVPATIMSGVSTHPDYRGNGHMTKTLEIFMQNARERGEYAVFSTPAYHSTYFRHLHFSATMAGMVSYVPETEFSLPSDVEFADINEGYAPKLFDLYTDTMTCYSNSVLRTQHDMKLKFRDYASSDAKLIRVIENKKTVAYCVYMENDTAVIAEEVCAKNNCSRDKLLLAIAHMAKECRHTIIKLPPKLIHTLPHGFTASFTPRGVMGAANISALLKHIAGFDDISVKVTDNIVSLNCGAYKFDGTKALSPCDIETDSGHLLQFLSGFSSIYDIVKGGFCRVLNSSVIDILDKRLPKLDCYVVEEY